MAKTKAKAKRYTPEEKQEILDFIDSEGRGGQTKAVRKFGVTAATIAAWRKKQNGGSGSKASKGRAGGSKELKALEELASILKEIEDTQKKLSKLESKYAKAKAKL